MVLLVLLLLMNFNCALVTNDTGLFSYTIKRLQYQSNRRQAHCSKRDTCMSVNTYETVVMIRIKNNRQETAEVIYNQVKPTFVKYVLLFLLFMIKPSNDSVHQAKKVLSLKALFS